MYEHIQIHSSSPVTKAQPTASPFHPLRNGSYRTFGGKNQALKSFADGSFPSLTAHREGMIKDI